VLNAAECQRCSNGARPDTTEQDGTDGKVTLSPRASISEINSNQSGFEGFVQEE